MAHIVTTTGFTLFMIGFTGACATSTEAPDSAVDAGSDTGIIDDAGTDAPDAPDAAPDSSPPACAPGSEFLVPGCGEGTPGYTPITAGCYEGCEPAADTCAAGLTCAQTVVNPCVCTGEGPCCGACGAEAWVCLPSPEPPGPCEGRAYCDCTDECAPVVDTSTGCVCECDEPFNCTGMVCDCACGGALYVGCAAAP